MTNRAQATPEISVINGLDQLVDYLRKNRKNQGVKVKVDAMLDETELHIKLHSNGLTGISGDFESLIYTFHFVF